MSRVEFFEQVREAVLYSYEAGQYPDDMPPAVSAYVAGDGGLLNILDEVIGLIRVHNEISKFAVMVQDLDRNAFGRHEGDVDVYSPAGVSLGNPLMHEGDIIGYDISGNPYVMPERSRRYDPDAWKQKREVSENHN